MDLAIWLWAGSELYLETVTVLHLSMVMMRSFVLYNPVDAAFSFTKAPGEMQTRKYNSK